MRANFLKGAEYPWKFAPKGAIFLEIFSPLRMGGELFVTPALQSVGLFPSGVLIADDLQFLIFFPA